MRKLRRASMLLVILACGCRTSWKNVTFEWHPIRDLLSPAKPPADKRPFYEQYPADIPISAGKVPSWIEKEPEKL